MGLDMYLHAKKFVHKNDYSDPENRPVVRPEYSSLMDSAGMTAVASKKCGGVSIVATVIYWRKSNMIHQWFVDNVQDGDDNCSEYYVSHEKLKQLLDLCKQVKADKNPELLPPAEGFFFGSSEVGGWYWEDIDYTIDELTRLIESPDFENFDYSYHSSW